MATPVSRGGRLHKGGVADLVMNLHIGSGLKDDADHFLVVVVSRVPHNSGKAFKLDTNASATFTPLRKIDRNLGIVFEIKKTKL